MSELRAYAELLEFLGELGYSESQLETEYPVWSGADTQLAHVVGFGTPGVTDVSTATLLAHDLRLSPSGLSREWVRNVARAVAAPAAIMWTDKHIEIWALRSDASDDELLTSHPRADAVSLSSRFIHALKPERLLEAKRGLSQPALFKVDVRLLTTARTAHASALTTRVDAAVDPILKRISSMRPAEQGQELIDVSRLVVGALAALVVRDKFELATNDPREILTAAANRFPGYFELMSEMGTDAAEVTRVIEVLGSDINYRSLDPRTVSDVYENAVVTESERLKLGIFYTPSGLAKRIAANLPFEAVEPDNRVTMDPACGSGALLIAAHNRLESLTPAATDPAEGHRFLTDHLVGFDQDQFAVEISRLALLLNAMPAGNSWKIERRDTPRTDPDSVVRPSLIVSNPPWADIRSQAGRRHQLADDFVEWMLRALRPRGFMGIVVPSGWLSSNTSSRSRALLREQADVFEVWRLPEGVFPSAKQAAAVVFARKTPRRGIWAFRRVVRPASLERFFETGEADEELLTDDATSLAEDPSYLRGPLDGAVSQLKALRRLQDIAEVRDGPVPEPPVAETGGSGGDFLWLRYARSLTAYGSPSPGTLKRVRFPEEFHRAGSHDGEIFRRKKVLVSAKRSANNPWRLKPAIDDIGVIPRESLYMITPHNPSSHSLRAIMALLASSVASCWVDQLETKMAINAEVLGGLPVPAIGHWERLDQLGHAIHERAQTTPNGSALRDLLLELDDFVAGAYGLPSDVRKRLPGHFRGFKAPEGAPRYPENSSSEDVTEKGHGPRRFGAVLDRRMGRLRLWVPGVTSEDGEWVLLPKTLPGWLTRPGATFEILMREEGGLTRARYLYQPRLYMDDEALSSEAIST